MKESCVYYIQSIIVDTLSKFQGLRFKNREGVLLDINDDLSVKTAEHPHLQTLMRTLSGG